MQAPVHSVERETVPIELPADFAQRLESSLREADRERRRLHAIDRLPLCASASSFDRPPSGLAAYADIGEWFACRDRYIGVVGIHP